MLPAEYYLPLKFAHIVSSVLMVGTGFGSAFYMFFANRAGSLPAQAVVSSLVVRADWWFTLPTVIFQPISGILLVLMAGWPLTTPWVLLSLLLYAIAGACWLPVVWLQVRMAKMAQDAVACGEREVPALYQTYARRWERLGYPAFLAMVAVYWLMVTKPNLWA